MQEKSTTIAHSRTNLYTSSVTFEHIDNTNIHLLQYPSHEGDNKQQRVDYKGVPLYKGRKYHVSFKDEVKPMQELVTYVNIQCFKEDYDVDSDSDIDFTNNNNNNNMTIHNNKYFINYKNCCCNIT